MIGWIDGDAWPELKRQMALKHQRLSDLRRLHGVMGTSITAWIQQNIAHEGKLIQERPSGWPNLSPRTLAAKRRKGQSKGILQASGKLKDSIRARVDTQRVVIGSSVPYAAKHQLGLGVPKRPFLPSAAQTRHLAKPVLIDFIRGALG